MSSQTQKGGDASVNIQASVVNLGVTYENARQIALDVFHSNFLLLRDAAKEVAEQRAQEFIDKFLKTLKHRMPEAISAMADPDMQYSVYTAQREYAKTGDKDLEEVLVDLLVERASQPKRGLMQIVLNESLGVAAKLTAQQFDTLTLIFLLRHTTLKKVDDKESAAKYIEDYYAPFLEDLTKDMSCYLHLEYSGCAHLSPGFSDAPHVWLWRNSSLLQKGFKMSEIDEIGCEGVRFDRVLEPCRNYPDRFQFISENPYDLKEAFKANDIYVDPLKMQLLQNLNNRSNMSTEEIEEWLIDANPSNRKLFGIWKRCIIACYTLTNVGKIIGNANFRRRTGHELDQEWDRSLSEERHWSFSPSGL